jgi:hypothetical protein
VCAWNDPSVAEQAQLRAREGVSTIVSERLCVVSRDMRDAPRDGATPRRGGHARQTRHARLLPRRRTKVIGRFPGETSCLTLVSAVLDLYITHAIDGIKFTQLERQRLKGMRYESDQESTTEDVTAA